MIGQIGNKVRLLLHIIKSARRKNREKVEEEISTLNREIKDTKGKEEEMEEIEGIEVKVNDANFKEEVLDSAIPTLVDFWAVWCAPCYMVAPAVEKIAREYQGKLKVCKVNVDEAPRTASEYGTMSIPTLAIFKNGEIVDKIIGVVPKTELVSKIEPHI